VTLAWLDAGIMVRKRYGTICTPRRQDNGSTPREIFTVSSWYPWVHQSSAPLRGRSIDVRATRRAQMQVWAAEKVNSSIY